MIFWTRGITFLSFIWWFTSSFIFNLIVFLMEVYSDICRELNALRSKCSLFLHCATRNFISISYHEHQEHNSWILAANFKVAFYVDNAMANVMWIGDCQMTNAGAEGVLLSVQWAYWRRQASALSLLGIRFHHLLLYLDCQVHCLSLCQYSAIALILFLHLSVLCITNAIKLGLCCTRIYGGVASCGAFNWEILRK